MFNDEISIMKKTNHKAKIEDLKMLGALTVLALTFMHGIRILVIGSFL
jgi:hypothetical protein